jgi:surface antigen
LHRPGRKTIIRATPRKVGIPVVILKEMTMKRILIPALTILVGALLGVNGCGSSSTETTPSGTGGAGAKTIEQVIPKANDIAGWNLDSTNSKTAGQLAAFGRNKDDAEALIDGSAAAFFKAPYSSVLAWQNYVNGDGYTVDLHLWQLTTAELAGALFAELLVDYPLYANNVWTDLAGLGDAARITNTGTTWWINLRKGAYIVEISLDKPPLGSEETDTTGREVAKAYAAELLGRF